MKVSVDFDSTLDREDVQEFVRHLLSQGVEVWVTTSRGDDRAQMEKRLNPSAWSNKPNHDLWAVCSDLGIPKERVQFTQWVDKWTVLKDQDFIWHLDDDEIEIELMIENETDTIGINVEHKNWRDRCEGFLSLETSMYKIIDDETI